MRVQRMAIKGRTGNEDAPTVVSCAFFGYRSLWSSSTAGSFVSLRTARTERTLQ